MGKNIVKETIDRIFEAEIIKLPKYKSLPEGQKLVFKGKMLEYMLQDLATDFIVSEDPDIKLKILRFFADYSGHKPKVEIGTGSPENPYEHYSIAELEAEEVEEQRKISDGT